MARVGERAFSGHLVRYRLASGDLRLQAAVAYVSGVALLQVGEEVMVGWEPRQAVTVPMDEGGMFDEDAGNRRDLRPAGSAGTR